jgi:hypothetical protein
MITRNTTVLPNSTSRLPINLSRFSILRIKTIPAYCLTSQPPHVYIGTAACNVSYVRAFFRDVITIYFHSFFFFRLLIELFSSTSPLSSLHYVLIWRYDWFSAYIVVKESDKCEAKRYFFKGAFWPGAFCPYVFLCELRRTKRSFK